MPPPTLHILRDPPGTDLQMYVDEYSATMAANKLGNTEIFYYPGDGCYYLEKVENNDSQIKG